MGVVSSCPRRDHPRRGWLACNLGRPASPARCSRRSGSDVLDDDTGGGGGVHGVGGRDPFRHPGRLQGHSRRVSKPRITRKVEHRSSPPRVCLPASASHATRHSGRDAQHCCFRVIPEARKPLPPKVSTCASPHGAPSAVTSPPLASRESRGPVKSPTHKAQTTPRRIHAEGSPWSTGH